MNWTIEKLSPGSWRAKAVCPRAEERARVLARSRHSNGQSFSWRLQEDGQDAAQL